MQNYKQHPILMVEDSDDDEQLILRSFKKMRLQNQIIVKRDGEEAIRHFFDEDGQLVLDKEDFPELILLDLQLPRVSGLEVLQRIRAHNATKGIPIAIFTSSSEDSDIQAAYKYGVNSFVQKPVDMHDFISAIHELGIYWLVRNTAPSPYDYA